MQTWAVKVLESYLNKLVSGTSELRLGNPELENVAGCGEAEHKCVVWLWNKAKETRQGSKIWQESQSNQQAGSHHSWR